jgi:adenylosuccinate lyase
MIHACPAGLELFNPARGQFESIVRELVDEAARKMEHGQVESLLLEKGYELLRLLLQGCLNLLTTLEPQRDDMKGPDGALPTH